MEEWVQIGNKYHSQKSHTVSALRFKGHRLISHWKYTRKCETVKKVRTECWNHINPALELTPQNLYFEGFKWGKACWWEITAKKRWIFEWGNSKPDTKSSLTKWPRDESDGGRLAVPRNPGSQRGLNVNISYFWKSAHLCLISKSPVKSFEVKTLTTGGQDLSCEGCVYEGSGRRWSWN